jgi:hypothetical protein
VTVLLAHAAPISYKFPLPIWLYVLAGGAAVLLSAPVAMIAVRTAEPHDRLSRNFYPLIRRLRVGAVVTGIGSIVILIAFAGGLFSTTEQSKEFFENPITLLTWVDFWVGLGIVSWLIGDFWELVSPFNIAARGLDRALARRDVAPLRYPERLGQWPAIALLLVWSWMELIWGPAKEPRTLALILLAYIVACLIGTALFGAEAWLGNVELFSVFARTLSRFSPVELRPFVPEEWASVPVSERSAIRRCLSGVERSCSQRSRPWCSTAGPRPTASERSSSGSTTAGPSSRSTSTCCRRCRSSRSWSRSSAPMCSSRDPRRVSMRRR